MTGVGTLLAVGGLADGGDLAFAATPSVGDPARRMADYDIAQADTDRLSPLLEQSLDFTVILTGVLRFDGQWVDQDIRGNAPGFSSFTNRRDLSVIGRATADNGLSYGFEYEIEEDSADLHLAGTFGRIDMGETDSATEALEVMGDDVMVGHGSWDRGGAKNANLGEIVGLGLVSFRDEGAAIRYTTPAYGGLTVAVSYSEESDFDMLDGSGADTAEDIVSVAVRHVSDYGMYRRTAYAGWEISNNGGAEIAGRTDQSIVSVGVLVRRPGASAGAGWGRNVNKLEPGAAISDEEIRYWFDVGVSFDNGPWAVALGAAHVGDEFVPVAGGGLDVINTSATAFSATFNFHVAPGLAFMGGITHWEINNGRFIDFADANVDAIGRADHSATVFTLSTQVVF